MYLRTFLLLVVVRLVWMKVSKTGFVDDSEPSLQYLDPSSLVTSLDVIESNINTLNEELNDITSKMKEHTLEAMADTTTETTEVIDEAIRNNEKVNQLLEHSEEKKDEKIEDILYMSETTKEAKQIPEMTVTPQFIVNNKKISNLTELTGEQTKEKKHDAVNVTEKIENNEKAINLNELLNKKEEIMESSKVNDEDGLTSKEITEIIDAIGMTIEEKMEKKSDDTVDVISVKNEKLSSKAVTEKIENNEKAINLNELFNKKEEIMESSKVNDEDGLTSKEITEIIDAIDMTIEENMERKSDDTVDVISVKNEKLSSKVVTEKIENNEKAINLNEPLNKKKEIMESSKVNDEDGLISKEITETIDAMTIEEKMEKKPVEFFQDFFDEDKEDFEENVQLQSEVDDPSTIMDTIISDGYKLNDEMEEDTKFIEEIKDKINFLEESMNKPANTLNLHLVDLERIEDVHEQIGSEIKAEDGTINENSIEMPLGIKTFDDVVKQSSVLVDLGRIEDVHEQIESESKAEDGTINENSIEMPLGVETFGDVVKQSSGKFIEVPSQEIKQFWNPIKVNDYKEENNVVDQKYSSRPKEGVDLWFPIHIDIEDLDHVEDSAQITQIENGEKAQDDIPKEKAADELTQTPDDELVYKETKFNPNVKLLLKRTGFLKDNEAVLAHKDEERSSWMIVVVGLPMMLLVLLLAVLMGIIILHKTDKKPIIFMKSLNLWGNDYDRMEISSIKKPKYNKIK